jgi:diguanylate cyclase
VIDASGDPPVLRGEDLRGLWNFARAWAQAMDGTSYVPMNHVEIEEVLFVLAVRLAAVLRAEPCGSTTPGYEIGAGLVAAGFDSPEGLGRTVGVIHDRLLSDLGFTGDGPATA